MDDSGSPPSEGAERWARLTEKQRDCLDRLLERKTSKMIARELGISKDTVDQRITAARLILGAADRDQAALIYGELKALYHRMVYDPAVLAEPPKLVRSDFPDASPSNLMDLHDVSVLSSGQAGNRKASGVNWWHELGTAQRVAFFLAIFLAAVILPLVGLSVGQSLTSLVGN